MKLGEPIARREGPLGFHCMESEAVADDGSVLYAWLQDAGHGAPLFNITPKHCEDALSDYNEEIERILDAEIYAPPGASLPRPTSAYSDLATFRERHPERFDIMVEFLAKASPSVASILFHLFLAPAIRASRPDGTATVELEPLRWERDASGAWSGPAADVLAKALDDRVAAESDECHQFCIVRIKRDSISGFPLVETARLVGKRRGSINLSWVPFPEIEELSPAVAAAILDMVEQEDSDEIYLLPFLPAALLSEQSDLSLEFIAEEIGKSAIPPEERLFALFSAVEALSLSHAGGWIETDGNPEIKDSVPKNRHFGKTDLYGGPRTLRGNRGTRFWDLAEECYSPLELSNVRFVVDTPAAAVVLVNETDCICWGRRGGIQTRLTPHKAMERCLREVGIFDD